MTQAQDDPQAEDSIEKRLDGTVVRLNEEGGYGFVRDKKGRDYFFHFSALIGMRFEQLREDQTQVVFQPVENGRRGLKALCVEVIEL